MSLHDATKADFNGFQNWWVYSHYEIRDDLVVPVDTKRVAIKTKPRKSGEVHFKGSGLGALRINGELKSGTVRTYSPMAHPELPSEFAKLAKGGSEDIL